MRQKVNYLFSYVFSVLFNACETWSLKQRNYERLEVFFNFCWLLILRRKRLVNGETISNNELHRLVKLHSSIVILPWQLTFFFGVVFKLSSLTARRMVFAKVKGPGKVLGGAEQVNYARCILAAMSFVLDHLESITLPKGLVSLLRNELDESTRTGIGHTLLKFSGRRQPGCFWATFMTPTHLINIIFMPQLSQKTMLRPLDFRTEKTMFRPPGDVCQAARILGEK